MGELVKKENNQTINYEPFNTRTVISKLEGIMDRVTSKDCTAETVNAACNCAARITDILRVHLDVERLRKGAR